MRGQSQSYFKILKMDTSNLNEDQKKRYDAYIARVKAEDKKDQEQKELNLTAFNDKQLNQLDKKSNKPLHGIAAQYKDKIGTSKFKLICYFNCKKDGSFYSSIEKERKLHRRTIPSIDFYNGISGVSRTDHEIAYNALLTYCLQNAARLDKAMLIVNDYIEELELTILLFNPKHIAASQSVTPVFKEDDKGKWFNGLDGNALRIDQMRFSQ